MDDYNSLKPVNNSSVQKIQITSLEEMEIFLDSLQANASASIASALNAQMQVIRYVSSPQLLDSTFDLFFQNLKKALDYAETPMLRDTIRERSTLMIQNYVFFMNAKLTYAIQDNKAEGRKLYEEAGKLLTKSVMASASLATTGGTLGFVLDFGQNLFSANEDKVGLFQKVIKWWNKEKDNYNKQMDFYKSIESLINKLYRRREIIGQSCLIAEMIRNYSEDLTNYSTKYLFDTLVALQDNLNKKKKSMKRYIFISLYIGSVPIITMLILQLLYSETIFWRSWGMMVGLFGLIPLIGVIRFLVAKNKVKKQSIVYSQKWNEVYNSYSAVANEFEE